MTIAESCIDAISQPINLYGPHPIDKTRYSLKIIGATMPIQSNILDPIHTELPPTVWDKPESDLPTLKPQHLKWIKSTVTRTLKDEGYTHMEKWLSLVLTGSLTTYQYSDNSDCDVSLFVEASVFPEWSRAEIIGIMTSKVDGTLLPGTTYPMQCFVVPPDVHRKDLYAPGLRSGYDLDTHTWVEPPDRSRAHDVEREMNMFYITALETADKMERLLRYEPDKAKLLWHQIHAKRRRDQAAGKGDYSESNVIYKFLANRGLFPALADLTGEYIAKTSGEEINVKTYKYNPSGTHPKIQYGRSFPWVYTPSDSTLHLGVVDTYHHDLLRAMGKEQEPGDILGRMSIPPDKYMVFFQNVDPTLKQALAERVGGKLPETEEAKQWTF